MTKLDGDAKDAHYSFPIFFQRDVTSQRSGIFFSWLQSFRQVPYLEIQKQTS